MLIYTSKMTLVLIKIINESLPIFLDSAVRFINTFLKELE